MHDVILYLIANPFLGIGLVLLGLLCVYNALRRQSRVAMGMWLVMVVVMFYVYVHVTSETAEFNAVEMAPPPKVAP
jgi:hypothetical protein